MRNTVKHVPSRLKLLPEPIDMSRNGRCSRCGQCCPSVVCVSDAELARLAERAKTVKPVIDLAGTTGAAIYARCPFLIRRKGLPAFCQAYEDRPRICRAFSCSKNNQENAERYIGDGGEPEPAVNLWNLFGLTGIYDGNGDPIPADNPYHVDVDLSGHRTLKIQMGQPITLWRRDGRYVPPSLVVGMSKGGLQVFNTARSVLDIIPFEDIDSLDVPENAVSRRPGKKERKQRRKKRDAD